MFLFSPAQTQRRGDTDEPEDAWAVQNVIGYLHGLIKVSNIVPFLDVSAGVAVLSYLAFCYFVLCCRTRCSLELS